MEALKHHRNNLKSKRNNNNKANDLNQPQQLTSTMQTLLDDRKKVFKSIRPTRMTHFISFCFFIHVLEENLVVLCLQLLLSSDYCVQLFFILEFVGKKQKSVTKLKHFRMQKHDKHVKNI